MHYNTLHYIALHCITLHRIALHYTTLHYTTLHYNTLQCIISQHTNFQVLLVSSWLHVSYAHVDPFPGAKQR